MTKQQCFYALKVHKEIQRTQIMKQAVDNDVTELINDAKAVIQKKQAKLFTKNTKFVSRVVKTMFSR